MKTCTILIRKFLTPILCNGPKMYKTTLSVKATINTAMSVSYKATPTHKQTRKKHYPTANGGLLQDTRADQCPCHSNCQTVKNIASRCRARRTAWEVQGGIALIGTTASASAMRARGSVTLEIYDQHICRAGSPLGLVTRADRRPQRTDCRTT